MKVIEILKDAVPVALIVITWCLVAFYLVWVVKLLKIWTTYDYYLVSGTIQCTQVVRAKNPVEAADYVIANCMEREGRIFNIEKI